MTNTRTRKEEILEWVNRNRDILQQVISEKFKGELGECYQINTIALEVIKRLFKEHSKDLKLVQGKVLLDRPIIDEGIETTEPYHVYIRFGDDVIDLAEHVFKGAEILDYRDETKLAGCAISEIEDVVEKCIEKLQCTPSQPCQKETPWGVVEGVKCQLGDELYHNTTLERFQKIVEEGKIKVPRDPHDLLGQDAISLSSCPTQTYGGNIKLVIPTKAVVAHPMCYFDPDEYPHVEKGLDEEAQKKINGYAGPNRVRSWHQVNSKIYSKECEYIVYNDIPASNIKRVEYWIPWQPGMPTFNVSCENVYPRYVFDQLGRDPTDTIIQEIREAKKLAEKIGADFDVKSCFTSVKTGWKDYGYPLNKENLEKLKKGIKPESRPKAVTETCLC